MAKQNTPVASAIETSIALIFWDPTRNDCRAVPSKADTLKELTESLSYGWNIAQGVVLAQEIDEVSNKTGIDYVERCLSARQARWDELKADKSAEGPLTLSVWESIYVDSKSKKLIAPRYLANATFQRGSVIFDACLMAQKRSGAFKAVVPVAVRHYHDESERLFEQLDENEGKDTGRESISDNDRLRMGKRLFSLGHIENVFRLKFSSSTTGQKVFKLCKIDSLYPSLSILSRIMADPKSADYVPYGPIKQQDLGDLIRRSDSKTLKPGETLVSVDDVANYFLGVANKSGNREKIMERKAIEGLRDNNSNPAVKMVAKAIIDNNLDVLMPLVDVSEGTQLLMDARLLNVYPAALDAIKAIVVAERARRHPANPHGGQPRVDTSAAADESGADSKEATRVAQDAESKSADSESSNSENTAV